MAVLKSINSLQFEVVRISGSLFFSGSFVGISRIVCDYLNVENMDMKEFTYGDLALKKVVSRDVA